MRTHETNQIAPFALNPIAIVALGTPTQSPAQPAERMIAAQAAIGRLVDLLCRLPAILSINPRIPAHSGRAQPGDVR